MSAPRITPEEVQRKIDGGEEVVFIDARSPASWESSTEKIRNAIRVPPDEVSSHLDRIPKGRSLVTYCT